jgi:hypothetical protein
VLDDATQNPMIPSGKNSGLYDRDYEAAMRLHFQENSGASSMPMTSQGVSPAVGGPTTLTMSQHQYQQQLQHQQALLQQQTLLQQEYLQRAQLEQQHRQQQELSHLQPSTPKVMLKGILVEDDDETNAPPDESNRDIVSPDLGMTQEELDRHTAMMLQFEDDKKAAKDRRRYEKRIRLRNRFLGLDETTGLDDGTYGGNDRSGCSIM